MSASPSLHVNEFIKKTSKWGACVCVWLQGKGYSASFSYLNHAQSRAEILNSHTWSIILDHNTGRKRECRRAHMHTTTNTHIEQGHWPLHSEKAKSMSRCHTHKRTPVNNNKGEVIWQSRAELPFEIQSVCDSVIASNQTQRRWKIHKSENK